MAECPDACNMKAFSLIELIISIALISILLSFLTFSYLVAMRGWDAEMKRHSPRFEATKALERVGNEVRSMNSVSSALQNSVTFAEDVNSDGADETIIYSWSGVSGEDLNRQEGSVTTTLANNVTSFTLQYYDSSDNVLNFPVTASQVRVIQFNLTAAKSGESFALRTEFRPRGL